MRIYREETAGIITFLVDVASIPVTQTVRIFHRYDRHCPQRSANKLTKFCQTNEFPEQFIRLYPLIPDVY